MRRLGRPAGVSVLISTLRGLKTLAERLKSLVVLVTAVRGFGLLTGTGRILEREVKNDCGSLYTS